MVRRDVLARVTRELRSDDQCSDARGDGRRGQTARILPPIELRERTLANDELRSGSHHRRVGVVVEAARHAQPPREKDRQCDLVELGRLPVRGPVHEPVLVPGTIGPLVLLEVAKGAQRGVRVACI